MSESSLAPYPNLLVKQTRKGWCQECMGCEANTEFKIATLHSPQNDIMYAVENTSCLIRMCCPALRPFEITVTNGDRKGGPLIATFTRPCACAMACFKCCCFQEVRAKNDKGEHLGSTTETCWICVPNFEIRKPDGSKEYTLRQSTCCGGLCVNCCAKGCCSCRVPFNIYDDNNKEVGEISKVWGGLTKEIMTDADTFETIFPPSADPACKARILAGVFLINQLFFESSKQNGDTVG